MDPRFVVAALVGAFGAAFVFATITVVRHIDKPAISGHALIERWSGAFQPRTRGPPEPVLLSEVNPAI